MKDRILNALMLLAVAAALVTTLLQGGREPSQELLPLAITARPAPDPTLRPADAYKKTRQETRAQEQAALLSLLDAPDTDADIRALAQRQLAALSENSEVELAAEAALLARGYDPALCVARAGEAVLFVPGELTARDAALILDIVEAASGLPRENIRVSGYAF